MRILLFCMAAVLWALPTSAATVAVDFPPELEGYWLGDLEGVLRLLFRIPERHTREHPVVTYSIDQFGTMIAANQVEVEGSDFVFFFDVINGKYRCHFDASKQVLEGKWSQGHEPISLVLQRFQKQDNGDEVPREFRFLLDKAVTGPTDMLQQMVGYWAGYLDDSFDDEEPEPPELVILELEQISDDLVEPKVHLPDETPLPVWVRSMNVGHDGSVKLVLDDPLSDNNAIFKGQWDGDTTITGAVHYDDTDVAPPLVLTWSSIPPKERDEISRVDTSRV